MQAPRRREVFGVSGSAPALSSAGFEAGGAPAKYRKRSSVACSALSASGQMPAAKLSRAAIQSLAKASMVEARMGEWAQAASALLKNVLGKEDNFTFLSVTLFVIAFVLLLYATRGVSLENVQYDIDEVSEEAAKQQELQKRALLGLGPSVPQSTPQPGSSLKVSGSNKGDSSTVGGAGTAHAETKVMRPRPRPPPTPTSFF